MGTHAVQRGATAETVSANVQRLRTKQNLGLRGLSKKLSEVGRPLTHSAVDQIEKGTRRVDVDDLMALAVALGVSPIALLMPPAEQPEDLVAVTGAAEPTYADRLWDWLCALEPLPRTGTNWAELRAASWPSWRWEQFAAADELQTRKQRFNEELDRRSGRA